VQPLELLHEPAGLRSFTLPDGLAHLYPGTLGLADECVYANFVETFDGVVALPLVPRSNRIVADESEADLLVMALLRACADAVIVGSHTLLASPKNRWTAQAAYPAAADDLSRLRQSLGLRDEPDVVVLSRSREIESDALGDRLLVRSDLNDAIDELHAAGKRRILCEGGPTLFGSMLADGLVDELFLTVSPVAGGGGLRLIEGRGLLPETRVAATLTGVRRHASHLFLRYAFER
jgi:riboflavin biosynthesis pyrimidine reductase